MAILNRNEPVFYVVPAAVYERLMDVVDDVEVASISFKGFPLASRQQMRPLVLSPRMAEAAELGLENS